MPRNSGLHFSSGPPPEPSRALNANLSRVESTSSQDRLVLGDGPAHLTRNKTERVRIGGLAQAMKERAQGAFKASDETRSLSGTGQDGPDSLKTRLAKWMVNEGQSHL